MLKRLRSAHPMLYCLVAEVLFLGMLFVASLLSLLLILFVVRDIDAVDDYMLTFMQEAAGVLVAWLFLARTGKSGLLRRRGSGFFNGLLVGLYPIALISYNAYNTLLFGRPEGDMLPAWHIVWFLIGMTSVGVAEEFLFRGVIAQTLLEHFGTILGTKRTPFKLMRVVEEDKIDKVAAMKKTYKDAKLDCLLCLGGNGTHKTANLLSQEGLNIIGLPKTIDNDIYGTDVTFGFHTAVDIATEVIDRIHTTAGSHSRVMCIEIMGNKAGWLTLYSGIAGGADIILLPEQPYDIDRVCAAVERRARKGSNFSIIAVAEGAINTEEAKMKRKEWMAKRAEAGHGITATNRIAAAVQKKTGMETRVCIPGHMQRGGSPSAYDRVLATEFGSYAAKLVEVERYGVTVAMVNNRVVANRLEDIAGKTRNIPEGCELLTVARRMGVSLG